MSPGFSREMPRRRKRRSEIRGLKNHQKFGRGFEFSFVSWIDQTNSWRVSNQERFFMCLLSVFLMQLLMPFISGLLCSLVSLGFYVPFIHLLLFKANISQVLYNLYWLYHGLEFWWYKGGKWTFFGLKFSAVWMDRGVVGWKSWWEKGVGLNDGSLDQRTNAISSLPLIMEQISSIAGDQRPPSKIELDGHCFFLLFHNILGCVTDQNTTKRHKHKWYNDTDKKATVDFSA